MGSCCACIKASVVMCQVAFAIGAVVAASIICAHIDRRKSYSEYFVGSGDDYDEVRESDRLLRVALILGVSGYWIYLAVVIAVAVGLGIGYKFSSSKCLPLTWMLTALMLLVSVFALSANTVSLVIALDASDTFDSVVPKVMLTSLRQNGVNVSALTYLPRRIRQDVEEDKTETSTGVLWDALHEQWKCCGYDDIWDYIYGRWNSTDSRRPEAVAPITCCDRFDRDLSFCRSNGTKRYDYNYKGCFDVLKGFSRADKNLVIIMSFFGISLVVASLCYLLLEYRTHCD